MSHGKKIIIQKLYNICCKLADIGIPFQFDVSGLNWGEERDHVGLLGELRSIMQID